MLHPVVILILLGIFCRKAEKKMMQIGQTEPKGYPTAYKGTPRGEVCSKHKAIRKEGIRETRIPSIILVKYYKTPHPPQAVLLPLKGKAFFLPCMVCAFSAGCLFYCFDSAITFSAITAGASS